MWEVMSYGERPYWDMSNQDVSLYVLKYMSFCIDLHSKIYVFALRFGKFCISV